VIAEDFAKHFPDQWVVVGDEDSFFHRMK